MKRILVIQLCRIGDILMTGPLLRGLRRAHPSAEISLMVMDSFASTPLPARLYDRLLVFPLGGLAGSLASKDAGWEPALDELRAFVKTTAPAAYDLVVNLTHTDMSALLTSLMPAKKRVGLVMRADRRKGIDSSWMTYMRASVRSRDYSCFHLVDLFSWTAGVGRDAGGLEIDVRDEDRAWAEAFLAAQGLQQASVIAIQLGASAESKRWPVERFAALADALDPSLGEILLVGGPADRDLGHRFAAAVKRRVYTSIGDSSLRQLAALLERSRLLITNDTGPMHVAAAVGTRVMDLSSGPVCPYETGPYGEGHVVIEPEMSCYPCPLDSECHHFACRTAVTPEDAAAVARFALGEGGAPHLTGARLLQARRVGRTGRIEFLPVGDPPTVRDAVRSMAAAMWEDSLKAPDRTGDGWSEGSDTAVDAYTHEGGDEASRRVIAEALDAVAREADAAAALLRTLPSAAPAKVQALGERVHASLEKLLALGESTRATHALVTHLRYEIDSIVATDLASMARLQAAAYAATAARARTLAQPLGVLTTS